MPFSAPHTPPLVSVEADPLPPLILLTIRGTAQHCTVAYDRQ